jgi:predicted TIM-barrel fold metal-dependent hydrolase
MKIINAHLHLPEIDKMMEEKNKYLGMLESIPSFKDAAETLQYLSIDTVLAQMEEAGISQSVLFACYAPIVYSSNEFVAAICAKHPDKFIGFASVDPRDENAVSVLENAVVNLGLRGLKLHPPLQDFFANDPAMWPVYAKAAELDIPVVFHVGSTPFGALAKLSQANPLLLDDVAVAFPTLKIMLTHLGTLWQHEAFMVVEKNPNVYIDTAAYPYEIRELLTENLVRRVGEDKFIFGTDFPMPYEGHQHRMTDFVETIRGLALDEGTKEKIFYRNFESMLSRR